ncbi:MAG: Yip1 family protein [Rhodobacter sp.]|nr:Yip1 family protein [Rhodobacter sp.]
MTLDFNSLLRLAWDSVRTPRDAARLVMQVGLPRGARWEALLLVVLVSVILGQITTYVMLGQPGVIFGPFLANPVLAGVVQMSLMVIMVFAVFWIGRAMGGIGAFEDAILLIAWMQFVMICVQVVQFAALMVLPAMASLVGLAGFALFFWLLTNFIAELHGFSSLGKVFVMILVSMMGVAFGLSILLSIVGVTIPGAP